MWYPQQSTLNQDTEHFKISQDNQVLSFKEWAHLLHTSETFRTFYNGLLQHLPFPAFYWEVKPVNDALWENDFEFVVVNSRPLVNIQADGSPFEAHFQPGQKVVSFPNLRGDAQLVVPTPMASEDCYGHLANFIRTAPKDQIDRFWWQVAKAYQNRVGKAPSWLSTAGLGVSWLHVRIDSTPKYYRHKAFKTFP